MRLPQSERGVRGARAERSELARRGERRGSRMRLPQSERGVRGGASRAKRACAAWRAQGQPDEAAPERAGGSGGRGGGAAKERGGVWGGREPSEARRVPPRSC